MDDCPCRLDNKILGKEKKTGGNEQEVNCCLLLKGIIFWDEILRAHLRGPRVQGVGSNETEHSYWSRAFKLVLRPLD